MSLRIWLPLTKDLRQQGLDNWIFNSYGTITQPNTGKLGNCLKTGATGTVYNNNISLTLKGNFSISYWLRIDASQASYNNFFSLDYDGNHYCGMCYNNVANSGTIGWHVRVNINGTATNIFDRYAFTGLTVGQWYHIGLTMENGTTCKMYLNGALIYTGNTSTTYPTTTYTRLTLGSKNYNNSYSNCSINDFRVYDHTLSQMEIKELSKGLVLHYPLNRQGWGQENLLKGNYQATATNSGISSTGSASVPDGATILMNNKGKTCWFSFDYSAEGTRENGSGSLGGRFGCHLSLNYNNASGTAVQDYPCASYLTMSGTGHAIMSFTIPSTMTAVNHFTVSCQPYAKPASGNSATWYLKNLKIEIGDKATPWCPHVEDALATTMGLNGTTEYDCSGFCNNGTHSGVTYSSNTPKYQVSTTFNVTTDSVKILPIFSNGQTINELSVACWFKTNTLNGTAPNIFSLGANGFCRARIATATSVWWYTRVVSTSAGTTKSCKTLTDDNWHHMVYTFNNGIETMYIDGTSIGTADRTSTGTYLTCNDVAENDWVLAGYSSSSERFLGSESDFRIYATALSADDVQSLYQNSAYIDSSGNVYGAVHSEV